MTSIMTETDELTKFITGPDSATLRRLISYFSWGSAYLGVSELKEFWESLDQKDKNYYHRLVATRQI